MTIPFSTNDADGQGLKIDAGVGGLTIVDFSSAGLSILETGPSPLFVINEQDVVTILAAGAQWNFQPDGSTQFPAIGEMGPVSLFTYNDNPNGHVTGIQTGDLCVTTEPALYQWTGDATPTWVPVAGGGGFTGTYSGTTGVSITDSSFAGISLVEIEGDVSIEASGNTWNFHGDGSTQFPAPFGGGPVNLFTFNGDPNGNVTGIQAGDLCVTTEPALYQWDSALATPAWVSTGFSGTYTGTTGVSIADDSFVSIGGSGGTNLLLDAGTISLTNVDVTLSLQPTYLHFTNNSILGAFNIYVSFGNPNGSVLPLVTGDLCVTNEPGLYQAAVAADDTSWVPVGLTGTAPTITGSRTDGTALASLLTALAGRGIIVDSTTS